MSESSAPIYVVLSSDDLTQAQVGEINQLTRELGQHLEKETEAVQSVSYVDKEKLPQETKGVLEVVLAEQVVVHVAPILINWVLGKIDAIIKSFSARGKRVKARVIAGNREVQITPKTTPYELNVAAQQVKAISGLSLGSRYALVIGNSNYSDEHISDLKSSVVDAERLAQTLANPNIGAFTRVETLINKTRHEIEQAIERFFYNRQREDLLLLYFSGHGLKSKSGQLFLAAQNTSIDLLRSTGISANFIKENMEGSNSQRQVLILDCCYGGAIVEGAKGDSVVGQTIDSLMPFRSSGFGRIIITASESMQYAFDGQHVEGETQNSAFTQHLIEGLRTGKADTDNDGLVDVDELYQYAYRSVTPKQTPNISINSQEGRMFIGLNPYPTVRAAPLPEQVQRAMQSEDRVHRQGAVIELTSLLKSPDPAVVMSAEQALRKLLNDDSRTVRDLAQEALNQYRSTELTGFEPAYVQEPVASVPDTARKSVDIPAPNVVVSSAPQIAYNIPRPKKNVFLGGLLNVIIPGIAHALVGNWVRAAITFVVVGILFIAIPFVALVDFGLCSIPTGLLTLVFLFFDGRNAFLKDNKKAP